MKKLLCIIFVIALIFTTVHAKDEFDLAGATVFVKNAVEIPDDCTTFHSSVDTKNGISVFYLTWQTPDDADTYKSVEVSISSFGDILHYYSYDRQKENKTGISPFTNEQLIDIAKGWIQKVNPEIYSQLDTDTATVYTSIHNNRAEIMIRRTLFGDEVYNNLCTVSVDKFTGEVISANCDWTYTSYEIKQPTPLDRTDAEQKFIEKSPMELSYVLKPGTTTAMLVYKPTQPGLWIDAHTGEEALPKSYYDPIINGTGIFMDMEASKEESATLGRVTLTQEEIDEITAMNNLIKNEDIVSFIDSLVASPFKGAQVMNLSYNVIKQKDKKDRYTVTAILAYEDGKEAGMVQLDAQTGVLLSLNGYTDKNASDKQISDKKLNAVANEFINKYASDIISSFNHTEINEGGKITLYRTENGIVFYENSLRVYIDPYTGFVTSYSRNYSDEIIFDDPSGIIDSAAAAKALFINNPLKKMYADLSGRAISDDLRCVYTLSDYPYTIDAKTSKLLNYDLTEYVKEQKEDNLLVDIAGHWAENIIISLIENDVIALEDGNTKFSPDETMTQQQTLIYVLALTGMDVKSLNDTEKIYTRSINFDILDADEKNPEMIVTRQTAVKYIVRALGYREIAELTGIYDCGFNDKELIAPGYEGYVSIAKGFSVIQGDTLGNFNPTSDVTRAELCTMMYKYLTK